MKEFFSEVEKVSHFSPLSKIRSIFSLLLLFLPVFSLKIRESRRRYTHGKFQSLPVFFLLSWLQRVSVSEPARARAFPLNPPFKQHNGDCCCNTAKHPSPFSSTGVPEQGETPREKERERTPRRCFCALFLPATTIHFPRPSPSLLRGKWVNMKDSRLLRERHSFGREKCGPLDLFCP